MKTDSRVVEKHGLDTLFTEYVIFCLSGYLKMIFGSFIPNVLQIVLSEIAVAFAVAGKAMILTSVRLRRSLGLPKDVQKCSPCRI